MKKIGTLKGIPVVEGNVNEVTKNQIHYKEDDGGIQLSKRDNDNKLNSITSGSQDFIYVGLKNPIKNGDSDMVAILIDEIPSIKKCSNYCYGFFWLAFGDDNMYDNEYILGFAIPKIPQFPINPVNYPILSTFEDLMSTLIVDFGFPPDDVYSNFYEISKEEFFTPFGEYKDVLTLEIDDKELIVDFAARKWFLTGEGWKDINTETNTVSVVGLLRLPYQYRQVVYNNVKYETTTNNYVVYGDYDGSYTFTNSRLKTNGVGPDPNYPKLDGAEAFLHSSGIEVAIMI